MEAIFDRGPSEVNKVRLRKAKVELDDRLLTEELSWRQRANIKWIKEGDHNTKYFH